MVAFTGFSNEGYNTLANSLSGLGNTLGNAYLKSQERQMLSDIGTKIQTGDLRGAADMAFKSGDTGTGVNLLKLVDEQEKRTAQTSADQNVLSSINGSVAPTSNTPMNLPGATPGMDEVSSYIVQSARTRGIDPNIALQVAKSEGLNKYVGDDGSSFGPYQLHYGGIAKGGNSVPGMGDDFTKATGRDARDPQTVKPQIDFALDRVKTGGWSPFHGWKGDPMAGIGQGAPVQVADASGAIPQSANIDGLMKRRENIMRGLSSQGISDNARQQLKTMLDDTTFQIQRADQQSQQPGARLGQEVKQRLDLGRQQGLQGDALQSYALTGKLPKEDQILTAGDREAIRTADESIQASQNVISTLTQAKELSKKALGFPGAGVAAKAGALVGNETSIATNELDNMIAGQALDSLRAVFGGSPTEGERKILLDIQGSSSQPDSVRQKIFDRAIAAAQKRLQFNQDRAGELRGGTYYKPQDQKSASGDVKSAKPIPSNILDEARAAIPRKGREAVINMLRQQGFDTDGL
jgi:hypothetical protein